MANDDVVMMSKLIKDGCDINHNDTAIEFWSTMGDEEWSWWIPGHTPLHIASYEGSFGE